MMSALWACMRSFVSSLCLGLALAGCADSGSSCGWTVSEVRAQGDFAAIVGEPHTGEGRWSGYYSPCEGVGCDRGELSLTGATGIHASIPHFARVLESGRTRQSDCGADSMCLELSAPDGSYLLGGRSQLSEVWIEPTAEETDFAVIVAARYTARDGVGTVDVRFDLDLAYRDDGCPSPSSSGTGVAPSSGTDGDGLLVAILYLLALF